MYIPSIPARQLLAARSASMSGTTAAGVGVSIRFCYAVFILNLSDLFLSGVGRYRCRRFDLGSYIHLRYGPAAADSRS